jgi:hypothetical protein
VSCPEQAAAPIPTYQMASASMGALFKCKRLHKGSRRNQFPRKKRYSKEFLSKLKKGKKKFNNLRLPVIHPFICIDDGELKNEIIFLPLPNFYLPQLFAT